MLRIPQSSHITGTLPTDCLVSYLGHSLGGGLTPLQRCSQCILQPQLTGQTSFVWGGEVYLICTYLVGKVTSSQWHKQYIIHNSKYVFTLTLSVQLAAAVEYTDYICAEGKTFPTTSVLDMTLNHLMALGNIGYIFITIPGPVWSRIIASVRNPSMGQIKLFYHLLYLKPFNYANRWIMLNRIIGIK